MIGDVLNYASKLNWALFPVDPRDKKPHQTGGLKDNGEPYRLRWGSCATHDERILRQWWRQWPNANIGLACKRSGLVVIDADVEGAANWSKFEADHALPITVTANTPSGGKHIIYRAVEGVLIGNRDLMNGVNVRGIKGDGGYIVIAPSIHPNGRIYQWAYGLGPFDVSIAPLPAVLIEALKPKPVSAVNLPEPIRSVVGNTYRERYAQRHFDFKLADVRNAASGHKHNTLNTASFTLGQFVGAGLLNELEVRQSLLSAIMASGFKDGQGEAERVIDDALRAGKANSGSLVIPSLTDSRMNQIRKAVSHERRR